MESLTEHQPQSTPADPEQSSSWRGRIRLLVWAVLVVAMLAALFLGSVSVVSYRYNAFTSRLTRDVLSSSFLEVWTEQAENLPEAPVPWTMSALVMGSVVVVLAGMVAGAWLLLVSSEERESGLSSRPVRRNHNR